MHIERAESVGNGSNRVHHFGMESTLLAIGHVAFLDRRLLAGNDLFFGGAEVEYDDKAPQGLFGAGLDLAVNGNPGLVPDGFGFEDPHVGPFLLLRDGGR